MPSRRTTRKAGTRRNQLIILGLLAVGLALTIFQVQRIQIDRSRADEDISRIKEYPYPGEVASESGTLVVRSSLDRLRITVDDKEGETNHKKKIKMFRVPFKMTVPVGDHIMRAAQEKYVFQDFSFTINKDQVTFLDVELSPLEFVDGYE